MATSKKKIAKKKPVAAKKAAKPTKAKVVKAKAKSAKPVKGKPVKKTAKPKAAAKKPVSAKPALRLISNRSVVPFKIPDKIIAPLADRILVSVEGESETTPGGLYIPATVTDRPHRGKVLAIGPGRRNKKGQIRPLDVSKGDTVLFEQYAGTNVTIEGVECLILREEEVLGIVT